MKKDQNTPKQLVHLGTVVQSTFGLVDENGNVIPQEALTVKLPLFNADYFNKAHDNIRDARDKLAQSQDSLQDPDKKQ